MTDRTARGAWVVRVREGVRDGEKGQQAGEADRRAGRQDDRPPVPGCGGRIPKGEGEHGAE